MLAGGKRTQTLYPPLTATCPSPFPTHDNIHLLLKQDREIGPRRFPSGQRWPEWMSFITSLIVRKPPAIFQLSHPLHKIFACLPVGSQIFLPDYSVSPTLQ